jgi:hypothetical protein
MRAVFDLSHLDGVWIVNERPGNRSDEFFHCSPV